MEKLMFSIGFASWRNTDCMWAELGIELMMIRIRIAWKSRCLVLGLLVGRTLGFN